MKIYTRYYLFFLICLLTPNLYADTNDGKPENTLLDNSRSSDLSSQSSPAAEFSPEGTADQLAIENHLIEIKGLENAAGAYDPAVGEQLYSLGMLYKKSGSFREASEVLARALHIERVNSGVNNMSQVPILNELIISNNAAGEWDDLNANFTQLLFVHNNNLEPEDPTLQRVLNLVGKWKLGAYGANILSEARENTLAEVIAIYSDNISQIETKFGKEDERLIGSLNGLASARYHKVEAVTNTSLDEFSTFGSRTTIRRVCTYVMLPDGRFQRVCNDVEEPNPNYFVGKQHSKDVEIEAHMKHVGKPLQQAVDILAQSDNSGVDNVNSLINLGDWLLISGRHGQAFDAYKEAYDIIEKSEEEGNFIDTYFDNPRHLPALLMPNIVNNEASKPPEGVEYVKVSFSVSAKGKPKRIRVMDQSNDENRLARKLAREYVKNSLFRPRLENGEPVATKGATIYLTGGVLVRR